MKFIFFILFLFSVISTKFAFSQGGSTSHAVKIEIPKVALLNILSDDSKDINYEISDPNKAGKSFFYEKIKNKIWVNYSSIVGSKNQKRKIIATMKDKLPKGFALKVKAKKSSNSGTGDLGDPTNEVKLSNIPSDIITGIGSCYTGKGSNRGFQLNYSLEFDKTSADYALFASKSFHINIVYTLTDDN